MSTITAKSTSQKYYETNADKIKAQTKAYYQANRTKMLEYCANYYAQDKDKYRNRRFLKQYGITLEEYNSMFNDQNGLCALCNKTEKGINTKTGELKMLAVDHDHKTGKVRALLCADCNSGLGCYGDEIELLERAVAYLKLHRGEK